MVEATKDFEELFDAFLRREVRFVMVGAHALAHHAKPRYTKDLDLFVEPSAENARLGMTATIPISVVGSEAISIPKA